jgi:hypothetical protein
MIYRIYPSKDATIYEDSLRKNQNTGKDEILEVGKFYDADNTTLLGNSRALLEFDLTPISSSIVSGDITSPQYRLRLENIESREIQSDYDLYVFPVKESWTEGIGSETDTPHNTNNVSWEYRNNSTQWDTQNSTVGKPLNPDLIASLQAYYDFAASIGNFELVDTIKGVNGSSPVLIVSGARMAMSSSHYSGGTANLSASLEAGSIYNIDFDFNRGTLSGVDFNIIDPNGYLLGDVITNYKESLVSTTTYNMAFTASNSGVYKLQFSFFDNNGSNGSNGSIDNFYIYKIVSETTLLLDQFSSNLTSLPSTYVINEGIQNENGITGSAVVSNYELILTSSLYGGATLNRKYTLQENANYTASFDIDPGNYPTTRGDGSPLGIEFTVMTPDGRLVDENDIVGYERYITSSQSPSILFQARQDGEYLFRWTFFGSGSGQYSASIDNIRLDSNDHDRTSARFTDIYYDARWCVNEGGGTWYTSSFSSGKHYKQSFTKYTDNLNVEITDYVSEWLNGTRVNNGLILKKDNSDECSSTKFGSIKFFSSDTHTIYPPTLEVRWDDSSWNTGSLEPLTSEDIILYVKSLQTEYKESSKGKIRVYGRDRYPARNFSNSLIKEVKYLPTTSYYSVVDSETNQVVVPFDTSYTKISCDSTSNYFNFWFNGLQPERFYKFIFRVDMNGTTKYYDDNFYFKVVR